MITTLTQNPDSIKNGNLGMKTCALLFGLAMTLGIYWKKRKLTIPWRGNHNVMTLNQTILLIILIYIDNTILPYYLGNGGRFLLNLEMLRIIFIENLAFKFLFPLLLIRSSKAHLPALWTDREGKRLDFFWTNLSYEARPVVFKYGGGGRSQGPRVSWVTVHIHDETNPTPSLTEVN